MRELSPQQYRAKGQSNGVDPEILANAVSAINRIKSVDARLFPLLTLNHLSHATGISYGYLRKVVSRGVVPYRHFLLKKRQPGRKNLRVISVPDKKIMICQKWISDNILQFAPIHSDSYAYHPKSNPVFAAKVHSNSTWLIKVDIQDFFHSISEHKVYSAFRSLGYSRLLSLELARICTFPLAYQKEHCDRYGELAIGYYNTAWIGALPQGAPTSPMISNLVMRDLDEQFAQLATKYGMRFSRYADDIVFSCNNTRELGEINLVKRLVIKALNDDGFKPNLRKTVIRGPGTRKIVLGLLVDNSEPRLTREFKDLLRMHLHYLTHPDFGPAHHADARKTSLSTMYHHVFGLVCWARVAEPYFGDKALALFNTVKWPPITKWKYLNNSL